ncbi:MAG: restriction endonuclease subunit S [Burkholderiales bacterium]|nr:restriction endonuclease subunit S [Burkholderiales bacterium]
MEVREPSATFKASFAFKQTEVGLIPADWIVKSAKQISEPVRGGSPRPAGDPRFFNGDFVPWLTVASLTNVPQSQVVISGTATSLTEEGANYSRTLQPGTLIIANSGATLGVAKILGIKCCANDGIAALLRLDRNICPEYLVHFINTQTKKLREVVATGNGQPNLNTGLIGELKFPLPPTLAEQQAIAEALSDADALIESLSLLLAKKRQIKQGAMQELLTGKKRLPGFTGTWENALIGSVAEVDPENLPAGTNRDFLFKYIALEDVERGMLKSHSEQLFESAPSRARRRLRHGDVLVGTVRPNLQSHLLFEAQQGEWVCSTGFAVVRSDERLHPGYLFEHMFGATVNRQIDALLTGSNYPAINSGDVRGLEIPLPTFEEQEAISEALSSMNKEVASLESRLAKTRDIKQGMMQALLTGRVRLVQPASNAIPLPPKPAANLPNGQPAHNWQINEAVVIGVLAQRFGTKMFPLPRKRRVKLMYLLHRHAESRAEGYLKKAAGPYDPNTKYKGPEQIALKNGYVRALRNDKYEGFVAGDKIAQAQRYFEQWYGAAALDWLERFRFRKTDDLELLATVDMAMVDLAAAGEPVDVAGVKRVIAAHPEWVTKLSRELFSDERIAGAIAECQTLFSG